LNASVQRSGLRRAVLTVALLNLAYFGVEFVAARAIGSVSLLADSVDFLEDASVNLLIFFAYSWSAANRARLGKAMAFILVVPAAAFLWTVWQKFQVPVPPEPFILSVTGLGALAVNAFCAFLLASWRNTGGSLTKAAFLSARNDAYANLGIIAAGLVTAFVWPTIWPDLIVGFAIAAMNLDAAREVWEAANEEHEELA
jgi:Co/Zn/Cd efflux system component